MLLEKNKTNLDKELLKKKKYINIFHNPTTAWFILITSLVLTVGAYFLSVSFVQQRVEDRFSFRTTEIESAIKDRLRIYEQVLWGGVGLWNASKSVSRQEWGKYVESLKINQHWPGIQGIGFSIPVQPLEKQAHIEKIRSEGFPEYLIKPEGTRDLYSAIIYLEPFDWRNQRAFGYDMWSNEMRQMAMTRARDEGVAATSGIITLVQETKEDIQRGFLMYLPVYQTKTIPKTLKEKRERFVGWVYAPFRAGDLMKGIVGTEDPNIEFEIFDGETMSQEALLFDSNSGLPLNQSNHNHNFQKTVRITLQGRLWTIQFNTHDTSSGNSEKHLPLLVALAGGFVDLLLFYVIYSLYFINRRAESIAEEMTQASRDANEKLIVINADLKKTTVSRNYMDSILQSMTDTLVVISHDATIQSMNQATLNLLGYEESELIGKSIKVIITEEEKELELFSGTGLKMLIEKGSVHGVEMIYTAKEGHKISMLFSGSVMKDKEGTFKGIACVAQDITDHKNAEDQTKASLKEKESLLQEIQKNEAILTSFTQALPDIAFIYDEEGKYVRVFATQKDLLIEEPEHLERKKVHDVLPKEIADNFLKVINETISSGKSQIFEYELKVKVGKKHFQARTSPMKIKIDGKNVIVWIALDISDYKQAEEKIIASLKEKQTLIDEIHHRVKNNMNVISSLLKLQANNIEDDQIKNILKESQNRIYAMSAVHETLHGSDKLSEIDLKSYLSKITTSIFQTYSVNTAKVKLNSAIENVPISLNQAYPLGLVINELISNSLKYAFPGERKGEINVNMKRLDKELHLTVVDDGAGMPDGFDWKNPSTLGLKLVRTLVENQLDGLIDMESNNGTKFIIKFNIKT